MPAASDVKYYQSEVWTYTAANGGRIGLVQILDNVSESYHSTPSYSEMEVGVAARWRKPFVWNRNASNNPCRNVKRFFWMPSPGEDHFLMADAGQTEIQADIDKDDMLLVGAGQLQTALSGGETSVVLTMESTDASFKPGGFLHLADYFMTAQTIDSAADIGDSVQWNATTSQWEKIALDTSFAYPKGRYVDDGVVLTIATGDNDCFLQVKDTLIEDEDIGTGDGSDTSPTLSTLSSVTNGLMTDTDHRPVITATCGGVARTVNVDNDGVCSGYCSAGEIDLSDGSWPTDITWNTAPDNGTDITVTYYRKPWSYSGSVATVELDEQVPYAFSTADTYASGVLDRDYIRPEVSGWVENVAGDGTYDESTYPLELNNLGTVKDNWTITIGAAGAISCSGTLTGALAAGNISSDYAPVNPATSQPYFTLRAAGFAGTWASGDTIEHETDPAQWPVWIMHHIPAGVAATSENHVQDALRWE